MRPRAHRLALLGVLLLFGAAACAGSGDDAAPVHCDGNCDCTPPQTVCVESRCVAGCVTTGCEAGYQCSLSTGFCRNPEAQRCGADADCSPPAAICENGDCVAGCTLTCCAGGTICDQGTGRCSTEPHNVCRDDGDCDPPATTCLGGTCTPATACNDDLDCAAPAVICGEAGFCEDGCSRTGCEADERCDGAAGRCVPDDGPEGCQSDVECSPPQQICVDTACVAGCLTKGCGDDERCETTTGRCVPDDGPHGCTRDADCTPPTTICVDTACVDGCGSIGCAEEERCETTTGRCVPDDTPICVRDEDCGAPSRICIGQTCVDGCGTTGCNDGERCDATTGRCMPDDTPTPCQTDAVCDPPNTICVGEICVEGCVATGCAGGERCDYDTGRCHTVRENLPVGAECDTSSECASGWCTEVSTVYGGTGRFCTHFCCQGSHCPVGTGCLYNLGAKFCVPAWLFSGSATFQSPAGGPCYDANECRDGVCDTTNTRCMRSCCTTEDCGPVGGLYTCTVRPVAAGYKRVCDIDLFAGYGGLGAACMDGTDCQSGLCVDADDGNRICTALCCGHADCGGGSFRCFQMGTPTGGGAYYFLSVCLPGTGGAPEGDTCSPSAQPSDCDGGLCVEGHCLDICCDDSDCPPEKHCLPATHYHADGSLTSNVGACQ